MTKKAKYPLMATQLIQAIMTVSKNKPTKVDNAAAINGDDDDYSGSVNQGIAQIQAITKKAKYPLKAIQLIQVIMTVSKNKKTQVIMQQQSVVAKDIKVQLVKEYFKYKAITKKARYPLKET